MQIRNVQIKALNKALKPRKGHKQSPVRLVHAIAEIKRT